MKLGAAAVVGSPRAASVFTKWVMGWLFSAIALASLVAGSLAGRDRTLHADE